MELYEIKNGLDKAHLLMEEFYKFASISEKEREIEGLTIQTLEEGFWDDNNKAQKIYDNLNGMKKVTDEYRSLQKKLSDLLDTYTMVKETDDTDFKDILESDYESFSNELDEYEKILLLSDKYDSRNAIMEIHPGAGGTESQDWAEMLFRMYLRYSEKKNFKFEVQEYLDGDVAGIKSVTILIKGYNAYGMLKSEKGVHRLVRLSPFDSSNRRHTSFASVDVIPEFDNDIEVEINDEDIRVDTYRASGAGGQHINKTDSAVRITHLATNTVVTCKSQRSQLQNREQAMLMLKSKLYQLMVEKQAKDIKEIQGEQKEIAWGSQIRSYVLHPYSLVKDNRSKYESNNPKGVLDGDLDDFIYAFLKTKLKEE
ncbi:MAG: peptide chain release factor 2 [Thomasclavelia sp.]|nr:peptide chain release factor 2 [Thomasclavelia sp.]